jgi:MoaA/NifB/PqqE/SkfB family radical SAM enzyme
MTLLEHIPANVRGAIRRVTPAPVIEAVSRRALRPISMVSREPASVVWFRRHILRRKPVLFHFEVHITDHCNLNCRGCAHFSNLCKPTFAEPAEFEADMKHMSEHFSAVEQIYLMGGEPLLHPKVAEFIRIARKYFPKTHISLMTNGTLVLRQDEEFWSALHDTDTILLCDSYPIGLPVDEINRLGREHDVRVEWTIPREEFFKIPIDPAGGHDPADSFRACQGFNNCPIIKDGRIYPCAYTAFADVFREEFGLDGLELTDRDSISIGADSDDEAIMEFLSKPVPWCAHCNMESREFYTWGRSKRELEEWTCAKSE